MIIKKKKLVKKNIVIKKKASKKNVVKRPQKKKIKIRKVGNLIGRITHYFSEIDVAVINLIKPIKIGEKIRIIGGQETDFDQKVSSLQIDHENVKSGKKGDSVGMKVNQKVHDGYKVFKV